MYPTCTLNFTPVRKQNKGQLCSRGCCVGILTCEALISRANCRLSSSNLEADCPASLGVGTLAGQNRELSQQHGVFFKLYIYAKTSRIQSQIISLTDQFLIVSAVAIFDFVREVHRKIRL